MKRNTQSILAAGLALVYLLGSYKGYLALWADGNPDPKQIFPCPINSLPQEDREALERGIYIGNSESLSRYLEDFLS